MTATLPYTNGSKPHSPSWLTASVQQFFSQVNWDDNPPELQELKQTAVQGISQDLNLTLTVHQFFAAVNWDGAAIASVPESQEVVESAVAKANEFTLDDFSNLF